MTFIVATNVVASRPPERRPTGTPHARANYYSYSKLKRKYCGPILSYKSIIMTLIEEMHWNKIRF